MPKDLLPKHKKSQDSFVAAAVSVSDAFKPVRKLIDQLEKMGMYDEATKYRDKIDDVADKLVKKLPKASISAMDIQYTLRDMFRYGESSSLLKQDIAYVWDVKSSTTEKINANNSKIADGLDEATKLMFSSLKKEIPELLAAVTDKIGKASKKQSEDKAAGDALRKSLKTDAKEMRDAIEGSNFFQDKTLAKFFKSYDMYESPPAILKKMDVLKKKVGERFANNLASRYMLPGTLVDNYVKNVKNVGLPGYWTSEDAKKYKRAVLNIDKVLSAFSNYLQNSQVIDQKALEKKAEAPPTAPLGQIAFGEERKDDVPFEPDTKQEKKLYNALVNHIANNIMLSDEQTTLIKSLLRKDMYSKFFKEPGVATAYRGMSVPGAWLRKALKLKKSEKLKDKGSMDATFTFTPRRGNASSWAVVKKSADNFSHEGDGEYSIIMHAALEDNPQTFVDCRGGLYNVKGMEGFESEKEAIAMGKVKVFKIEWNKRD